MTKLKFTKPATTRKAKAPVAPSLALKTKLKPITKIASITALLKRPTGASLQELMGATGWQAHSVRGALSGTIKKQLKMTVTSEKSDGGRVYRIVDQAA